MILKLVLFVSLLGVAFAVTLKAPIHKHGNYRSKLIQEKQYEEFRSLNQILLAKYAQYGHERFDKTSQPLYDFRDQEYNVRLTVGTPGQTFELLPDTAEANTWIIDKACDGNNSYYDCPAFCHSSKNWCQLHCHHRCCGTNTTQVLDSDDKDPCTGKRKFDPSASSTYSTKNVTFHSPYGVGNISGIYGIDTFTLGDKKSKIDIPKTTFGLVNRLSTSYANSLFDGILGLAFQSIAIDNVEPVFQHGVSLKLFDQPIFTIYMKPDSVKDKDVPVGSITFGGLDTDNCKKDYYYVNLKSERVWWFNIDAIELEGKQRMGPFLAMSSLGTAVNIVPSSVLFDLTSKTGATYDFNTGFYQVDCNAKFTWSVIVGGINLKADQSTLVWRFKKICYLPFLSWGDEKVKIDIILGVPFLQQFCVAHDVEKGQIGFSKAN